MLTPPVKFNVLVAEPPATVNVMAVELFPNVNELYAGDVLLRVRVG